jgi:hypothetical protein
MIDIVTGGHLVPSAVVQISVWIQGFKNASMTVLDTHLYKAVPSLPNLVVVNQSTEGVALLRNRHLKVELDVDQC